MNKLTEGLKIDSGKATTRKQITRAAYTVQAPDKKIAPRHQVEIHGKCRRDQSDKEEVHRSKTADAIDFKERDSNKDPTKLAMDKRRKGEDIYSSEQERVEQKTRYKAPNYKIW
eukprot:1130247-Heterocapsa_arctica.AAC.1